MVARLALEGEEGGGGPKGEGARGEAEGTRVQLYRPTPLWHTYLDKDSTRLATHTHGSGGGAQGAGLLWIGVLSIQHLTHLSQDSAHVYVYGYGAPTEACLPCC